MPTSTQQEPAGASKRVELPPYPIGWYALAFSDELEPEQLLSRHSFGRDLVLFRTRSGVVSLIDAHCPHRGAHFGHGGKVTGESIQCPFHGFCFDTGGTCVSTGHESKPPRVQARTYTVVEKHGIVLAWFHPKGRPPDFHISALDVAGWSALTHVKLDVRSHPQETLENSVDLDHLQWVHHCEHAEVLAPFETDGPVFRGHYALTRKDPLRPGRKIKATIDSSIHGLGYSQMDVRVHPYGFHFRVFILGTPRDGERMDVRAAVSMHQGPRLTNLAPASLRWLTGRAERLVLPFVNRMIQRHTLRGVQQEILQDFAVWEHKIYLHPPYLAKGDGPVHRFRSWARQFYTEPSS
ncbi:MAG: aromatic ring-hydroxylating oxygenase subunit alpha [Planctomycetota bacterium]|jgi:phenylpropionate dioxygenase-like ring-hydroxylating dioxygenase large terminal subunit